MKKIEILISMNLCILLVIIGTIFNFAAIIVNDGKMPIKVSEGNIIDSDNHFSFVEESEVSLSEYSDIYKISFKDNSFYFSRGDIFLYSGGVLFFVFMIQFLFKKDEN